MKGLDLFLNDKIYRGFMLVWRQPYSPRVESVHSLLELHRKKNTVIVEVDNLQF